MALEVKRDLRVIIPYTAFTVGTLAALILGKITVEVFLAILGALNVASAFGIKKPGDDDQDPPTGEAPVGNAYRTGGAKPLPTPPNPPNRPIRMAVGALLLATLAGCAHASRAEARGAVLATAEAVKAGDAVCAKYALERADLSLAKACEDAYDGARASVLVASSSVDTWDESKRSHIVCAVTHAAEDLSKTATELRKRGYKVPPIIDDALTLVDVLGGCHE